MVTNGDSGDSLAVGCGRQQRFQSVTGGTHERPRLAEQNYRSAARAEQQRPKTQQQPPKTLLLFSRGAVVATTHATVTINLNSVNRSTTIDTTTDVNNYNASINLANNSNSNTQKTPHQHRH